jgi:hypothetical protein
MCVCVYVQCVLFSLSLSLTHTHTHTHLCVREEVHDCGEDVCCCKLQRTQELALEMHKVEGALKGAMLERLAQKLGRLCVCVCVCVKEAEAEKKRVCVRQRQKKKQLVCVCVTEEEEKARETRVCVTKYRRRRRRNHTHTHTHTHTHSRRCVPMRRKRLLRRGMRVLLHVGVRGRARGPLLGTPVSHTGCSSPQARAGGGVHTTQPLTHVCECVCMYLSLSLTHTHTHTPMIM